MKRFSLTKIKKNSGLTAWKIGGVTTNDKFTFPSDERISQLWKKHVPDHGDLQVVSERNNFFRLVAIPLGTNPQVREPFVDALNRETTSLLE